MKSIMRLLLAVLVLLVLIVVGANMYLGAALEKILPVLGPRVLGVSIALDDADVQLLRGKATLTGLRIGNPAGFKSASLFDMGSFDILFEPRSVLSDRIVIREIVVIGPVVTYEGSLRGSNVGRLLEGLQSEDGAPSRPAAGEDDAQGGKRVEIDRISVREGQVKVALSELGGSGLTLPLPAIELRDIGKSEEGATLAEAIGRFVRVFATTAIRVVTSSPEVLQRAGQALGAGATVVGGAVGEMAVGAGEAVGAGAAAVGEAVGGAATQVGDAAGRLGSAVGTGLSGLGRSLMSGTGVKPTDGESDEEAPVEDAPTEEAAPTNP